MQRFTSQWTLPWGSKRLPSTTDATDPEPTAIAVHDEDGRIRVDVVGEDVIDLTTLQKPQVHSSVDTEPAPTSAQVPTMNICIMIVGTRGDVQPFLGIAKRLQQDGHRVRLATHAVYRDFVMEHNVEFYPLGGDPKELAAYMVKTGGHLIPVKYENITQDVPRNIKMLEEILNSTWPAVSAPDPDGLGKGVPGKPFQAQAIISNPVTYGHIHVAERLGVPLHIMFPQPWVPTVAFPHPLSNMPYDNKPQKRNYMSYKLVDLLMWQGTESMVNEFRTEVLGLRKIRKGDGGRDILLDLAIPHAFMWSPALVPKPSDWSDIYDVIGTVLLKEAGSKYSPTPELEAFLGTDGGPIFVGFGSMVIQDPVATTKMIIDAAKLANNARVLIQSSWSDMAGGLDVPANIFFLGNCPHDWLMPRVSAVVHHGGAGTTAAGLLAGKPTFIVPFFGDQPFWGRAVVNAGVGAEPCPIKELTVAKLHAAFVAMQSPVMRQRAMEMRDILNREDGVGEAVKCFYRHLPLKVMRCQVCGKRMAVKWSVVDRVRLCEVCHYVVSSRPQNFAKNFVDYRCVEHRARGPSSGFTGASAGVGALLHEMGGAVKDVFVKPARGFRHDGAKGVAIGFARGLSGLVIRPVYGVALLADHIAAGHRNFFRSDGTQKRDTVFDNHILYVIGHGDGGSSGYVAPGMSPGEIDVLVESAAKKETRRKVMVHVSDQDLQRYITRFEEILKLRQAEQTREVAANDVVVAPDRDSSSCTVIGSSESAPYSPHGSKVSLVCAQLETSGSISIEFNVADDTVDSSIIECWKEFWKERKLDQQKQKETQTPNQASTPSVPVMSICLATIGTWHSNVKQFVAIAVRLAKDGHRVRVAAHKCFREEVVGRGLEFYPLEGSPTDIHQLIRSLQATSKWRGFRDRRLSSVSAAMKKTDARASMFSLWPAVISADPDGSGEGISGEPFRADLLICHPLLLSHVHVAERLGIPLHCLSMSPLSPTFSFPHILSQYLHKQPKDKDRSSTSSTSTDDYRETNRLSYGVVDSVISYAFADTMDDFRASIGLSGGSNRPNLLADWEVPHTYLWDPSVVERPLDWGTHLSVTGYVTLDDERERIKWRNYKVPRSLNDFVLSTGAPAIYIGFSSDKMDLDGIQYMVQRINDAARCARVLVILQLLEPRPERRQFHSETVYEVPDDFPYALLLKKAIATILGGPLTRTCEALVAGKPVCVWPRLSMQSWFAGALTNSGFGPPPIDLAFAATEEIVSTLHALVGVGMRTKAEEFATHYSPEAALDGVVESIYSNLPLPSMVCDLDETKIAHVYDVVNEMKLSYEAHWAVRSWMQNSSQPQQDVPYKPLYYSGHRPPKYSLRGIRGEPHRRSPAPLSMMASPWGSISAALHSILHTQPVDDKLPLASEKMPALNRTMSVVPDVQAHPMYWASEDEARREKASIWKQYERVQQAQMTVRDEAIAAITE